MVDLQIKISLTLAAKSDESSLCHMKNTVFNSLQARPCFEGNKT